MLAYNRYNIVNKILCATSVDWFKMKLHDAADSDKTPSELLPPEMQKSTPVMEDFSISVAAILKLLKNLKPGKAAGPDRLKPILLKELCEEIAPIIQVIC